MKLDVFRLPLQLPVSNTLAARRFPHLVHRTTPEQVCWSTVWDELKSNTLSSRSKMSRVTFLFKTGICTIMILIFVSSFSTVWTWIWKSIWPNLNLSWTKTMSPRSISVLCRSQQCPGYTGRRPAADKAGQQVWMFGCVNVKQGAAEQEPRSASGNEMQDGARHASAKKKVCVCAPSQACLNVKLTQSYF